jgi:hypothetical protein
MEAARKFTDHLNGVLNRTVTHSRLTMRETLAREVYVSFRDHGSPTGVVLTTHYGAADLYLAQVCGSDVINGAHHLRTLRYTYTVKPAGHDEPLLRWEYVRHPEPKVSPGAVTICRVR